MTLGQGLAQLNHWASKSVSWAIIESGYLSVQSEAMQGVRRSAQHGALLARQLSHSFASSTSAAAAKGSAPAFASVDALRAQLESGAGACLDKVQHNRLLLQRVTSVGCQGG